VSTRRRAAIVALVVTLLGLSVVVARPASPAGPAPSPAIQWSVDKAAKTITVTVTMAFFSGTSTGFDEATPLMINHILASIQKDWGGHDYECYKLVVKLNSSIVGGQTDVPGSAIGIRIDPPASGVIADTTTTNDNDNTVGTDPADRGDPQTGSGDVSTWPEGAPTSVYAHEFGHILGLGDSYDPNAVNAAGQNLGQLLPGMANDVMYAANPATANTVSEDSINRAVERSGQVDTSNLDCNMTLDVGPSSNFGIVLASVSAMKIHAWTCNYQYQSNDPAHPPKPMHWQGKVSYSWQALGGKHGTETDVPTQGDLTTTAGKTGVLDFTVTGGIGTLHLTAPFSWTNDGLVQPNSPFSLGAGGGTAGLSGASIEIPSLTGTVTSGASECKGG